MQRDFDVESSRQVLQKVLQNPASARLHSFGLRASLKAKTYDVKVTFELFRANPRGYLPEPDALMEKRWLFHPPVWDPRAVLASWTDFQISTRCIRCHKETSESFRCETPGCISGAYCSDECRSEDQPRHAGLCEQLMGVFADQNRPPGRRFRAFLFAHDEREPKPIWLQCEHDMERGMVHFKFDQESVLRWASERGDQELTGWANAIGGQHGVYTIGQGNGILVFGLKQVSGNKPWDLNRGLDNLASPGLLTPEFGPIIVMRYFVEGGDMAFLCFGDASPRDLQLAIDGIFMSASHVTVPDPSRHRYRTLPALKINDLGSPWVRALGITDEIQEVRARIIGNLMPQFPVLFTLHIGLIYMIRPVPMPEGIDDADVQFFEVPPAWQWIVIDHRHATDAERSDPRVHAMGGIARRLPLFCSFLVYDAGGRRIHKHHILAVTEYFSRLPQDGGPDLTNATRADFEAYWGIYQAAHEDAREVSSPYHIREDEGHYDLPTIGEAHPLDSFQLGSLHRRNRMI